ncbi:MAG: bifunctional (p)ppGpp synthetase/guanosine-3',5'-bis(diphosphate) 3'-pyrophosphohydrolase [Bacteroidetes bacterium]|nr:bifunctional (p)ppGpp synthetase/guanosine-3',5'-bis(diphosphate) 3'-pyrophosphohydrolase [Bacteroidota bacterium]
MPKHQNYKSINHTLGINPEEDLELLLAECRENLPKADEQLISKAFRFCVKVHENDRRASGEPYYIHLLEVARIVVREIPLDDVSVAAALLHDIVEDHSNYSIKDIYAEFGSAIADIVDGVTKITDITKSREIKQAESYLKLVLSLVKDVRVILLKVADRLHNMRTLDHLTPARQSRIAQETLDVFAPFAHRFGLGSIKWELEDLAFKYLDREQYDFIKKELNSTRTEREKYIERFIAPITERLNNTNASFEIYGRPKHIHSIYNKMASREKSIDELYDLFAIRIILNTESKNDCFFVYGLVSEIYTPVPERFKDYISVPKKNGYQSLHTTVIGADGKRVEVQIRTRSMHEVAEKGVAAHFRYKSETLNDSSAIFQNKDLEEWANWMRDILENNEDNAIPDLLESFKLTLYQNEIHVFTPKGELRNLPLGATPLDFAFAIHSQVGNHCIGAKVNGRIVPLDYKLQNGDSVEILTSKNQMPNRDWERLVVTHKAKSHIRRYLNEEKRNKQREGKELWERKVKKVNLHLNDDTLERILQTLKFENKGEFYYALGIGTANVDGIAEIVREKLKPGAQVNDSPSSEPNFQTILETARGNTSGVYVVGDAKNTSALLYSYAKCCNPVPGDEIVGVVTTGIGIKVHRQTCKNILDIQQKMVSRLMELQWSSLLQGDFISAIRITGEDRTGMLNEITTAVASYNNTSIRSVNIHAFESVFEGVVTLFVQNTDHLKRIFDKLKKIKGVKTIDRFEG